MHRKQVVVAAIGLGAAIAVIVGGLAIFAGRHAAAPVTTASRGQATRAAGTPTAEAAACGALSGQPSGDTGTAASKGPWRVRLGPGESLEPTAANIKASRRGQPLVISGRVLLTGCAKPVAGATVHVWQTNGDGEYGPSQGDEVRCCYLQGTMTSDAHGRYQFESVRPGRYGGPAHIHFQVRDQHGRELTTELLFADDPSLGAQERADAVSLTRTTSRDGAYLRGTFDIELPAP